LDSRNGEAADPNISRHLVLVSSAVRIRIANGLVARGHQLSVAVTHIVNNLPPDGLGMSALSHRAGLSLQRTGQLVAQLEEDGYVERVPDAEDGRARQVVYTRRGHRLLRDINELLRETNDLLAGIVGETRFEKFLEDLAKLDHALNADVEGVRVVID
jgi:DNA-binding MarR family transcriptional regulator